MRLDSGETAFGWISSLIVSPSLPRTNSVYFVAAISGVLGVFCWGFVVKTKALLFAIYTISSWPLNLFIPWERLSNTCLMAQGVCGAFSRYSLQVLSSLGFLDSATVWKPVQPLLGLQPQSVYSLITSQPRPYLSAAVTLGQWQQRGLLIQDAFSLQLSSFLRFSNNNNRI